MTADLYEFVASTTDVPWAEAEACGWFNCPDAGGWLRQIKDGAVLIEDRGNFVTGLAVLLDAWSHKWGTQGATPTMTDCLKTAEQWFRAAVGKDAG